MATHKTATRQTFIGEAGMALIHQRVLQMGHLWHPRRVDHGIDGHIDLVDPATGHVLNSTVLVQSKAQKRPFQSEDEHGFHYLCDPRDLDLWLGGNAPVILVLSHPDTGEAWWVDVRAAFPDAIARATRRINIEKSRDQFDVGVGTALLRLGVPTSSGLYLTPAPKSETLTSNLLEITAYPQQLYLAPAVTASYKEADHRMSGSGSGGWAARHDAWILADGLVLSFADLREPRWRALRAGDVEVHDTAEWAESDETGAINQFTDLGLRTVERSYPQLRWHNDRQHVHFSATSSLTPLRVGKGPGTPGRTVFGPHGIRDDGTAGYYHHAAAQLRLRRLAGRWYLQITPDWCFTSDGWAISPNANKLTAGIKRMERHPAVAGWVRMWARYLRGSQDLFTSQRPITFGDLLTLVVDRGIDDSHWGAAPADDQLGVPVGVSAGIVGGNRGDAAALIEFTDLFNFDDPETQQTAQVTESQPSGPAAMPAMPASSDGGPEAMSQRERAGRSSIRANPRSTNHRAGGHGAR